METPLLSASSASQKVSSKHRAALHKKQKRGNPYAASEILIDMQTKKDKTIHMVQLTMKHCYLQNRHE